MAKRKKKADMPAVAPEKTTSGRSGVSFTMWLEEKLNDALNAFVESQRPKASKKEHISLAIEQYLEKRGAWPVDN